jgi:poly-gamma-glutamate capsule biosynthesis protein CapA/YwtB (metallophosphatase superfamily)
MQIAVNKKTVIFSLIVAVAAATICFALFLFIKQKPAVITETEVKISKTDENIPKKPDAELLFVGDAMFDRGIRYYASENGRNNFVFDKISEVLLSNDMVIANLEGPITNEKSVSANTPPGSTNNYFFTFDPSWAETLYKQNIKLVNLGNNHILNFGKNGLDQTKKYLDKAGVDYFGSPDYPKSTSSEIKGIKITFINYNEFANLTEDINQKSTIEEIQKAKKYSDIIIIYCHWGVEYTKTPTDAQITLAHQFIDEGADLIIGSHPHVIQTAEEYKGKKIYYSLGNFIFDQYFNEDVHKGLGIKVNINQETKQMNFSEINFYLQNNGQTILKE